ncbi:hypothetical protein DL96DRAFT_1213115 [Flagelloscypha sp. PMI_526]|nr:hypothetical protein DL96DRAFT_1213115 [Flagelloscypha sp. PMI_526]
MSSTTTLPHDILEVIIDFSSLDTVSQWSLTCKALLTRARMSMFSHVTLNYNTCQRVRVLLSISPHLGKYIHHIAIRDMYSLQQESDGTTSILNQICDLRTISLLPERYMGFEWNKIDDLVKETLYECFRRETLQGVDAQFFQHCRSFFERCPRLKHLDLYHPIEDFTRSSPQVARIELRSLRLAVYAGAEKQASLDGVLGSKGDPLFDFSHLERLVVDSCSWHHSSTRIFCSGQWIAGIAPFAFSTLQELFWEASTPDVASKTLNFHLHTVPTLTTLVVRFNLQNQPIDYADCCRWITQLMDSRLPLEPIKSSAFSLPWNDDQAPLCNFIASVQGSRQINLHISPPRNYSPGILSEAKECALRRQPEFDVRIMIATASSIDTFRVLRLRRPFGHDLALA